MIRSILLLTPLVVTLLCGCPNERSTASAQLAETNYFRIETPGGEIVVRLYDETPLHRDNFRELAAKGAFDSTLFHRVIAGFMIQGGDPNSRDADPSNDGSGGPGYTIPAEIRPELYHKRGALAAARRHDDVNPERESSGSQFYIVHGTIFPREMLLEMQSRNRETYGDSTFAFSHEALDTYTTVGGAPNLDGGYTVFGEVVSGMEVVDYITRVATTPPNRPLVPMWMRVSAALDWNR